MGPRLALHRAGWRPSCSALSELLWRAFWWFGLHLTRKAAGFSESKPYFSGEVKPARHSIVLVKFFGGLLAMGSGLALGREGPTVQMGASLGSLVGRFWCRHPEDRKVVDAAGAGAGLAVAFNAPIGGSVFVFEELTSNFTPWLLVATLAAASMAIWMMRLHAGQHPGLSGRNP